MPAALYCQFGRARSIGIFSQSTFGNSLVVDFGEDEIRFEKSCPVSWCRVFIVNKFGSKTLREVYDQQFHSALKFFGHGRISCRGLMTGNAVYRNARRFLLSEKQSRLLIL